MAPKSSEGIGCSESCGRGVPTRTLQFVKWKSVSSGTDYFGTGQPRYLIDYRWLQNFYKYIAYNDECTINSSLATNNDVNTGMIPTRIDNSKLVVLLNRNLLQNQKFSDEQRFVELLLSTSSEEHILCDNLKDNQDYALLNLEQWNLLSEWYGGGPRIERKMVHDGQRWTVELYPLKLWLYKESEPNQKFPIFVSRADLCVNDGFKNRVIEKLRALSPCNVVPAASELKLKVNGVECSLDSESGLQDFAHVVVKDISCRQLSPAMYSFDYPVSGPNFASSSRSQSSSDDLIDDSNMDVSCLGSCDNKLRSWMKEDVIAPGHGIKGLQNIGNTCFMNSALQCLSNTEALTRYFLQGHWQQDLNEENPLGMKGQLAEAYCSVLQGLWGKGQAFSVNPRELKAVIARFAPHFAGFLQHDAQELLSFLLDGLHEDLNRVREKPLVELPTGDGTNDDAVACLAWQRHRARNDSVLVDIFGGQYRSELVCPVTGRRSVTFDPFNCLTLQLPQAPPEARIRVLLHRCILQSGGPVRHSFSLPCSSSFLDLRRRLESVSGVSHDHMVLADVFGSRFFTFHDDTARVFPAGQRLRASDVHAFETPVPAAGGFFRAGLSRPPLGPADGNRASAAKVDCCTQEGVAPPRRDVQYALLAAVHRRARRTYYRQVEMEAFGTPAILAVPLDPVTGGITYQSLWTQVCVAAGRLRSARGAHGRPDGQSWLWARRGQETHASQWEGLLTVRRIDGARHYEDGEVLDNGGGLLRLEEGETVGIDWTEEGLELVRSGEYEGDSDTIDEDDSSDEQSCVGQRSGEGQVRLERLLEMFSAPEQLSEGDAWFSPFCRQHVRATKTMSVWAVPAHLVVHLKRFAASAEDSYDLDVYGGGIGLLGAAPREKLDTLVRFPVRGLDMTPYVRGPKRAEAGVYDLYGVVNHYGGAGFGHYTAFCLSPADGKWRRFDDSDVETVDDPEEEVVTRAAYLLFYRRRGS